MKLTLALLLGATSMVSAITPRVGLAAARSHGVDRRRHHAKLAVRSAGTVPIISRAEHAELVKRAAEEEDCEEAAPVAQDDEDCDEDETETAAAANEDCEDEPAPSPKAKAVAAKSSPKPSPKPQVKQAAPAPKPSPQPKQQSAPAPESKPKVKVAAAVSGGTSGIATFFTQDGTEGACGRGKVPDSALVVALCPAQFRSACGKPIRITNTKTGKTATAIGNDECPECPCDHIDLSIGAWDALGSPQSLGVAPIKFTIG